MSGSMYDILLEFVLVNNPRCISKSDKYHPVYPGVKWIAVIPDNFNPVYSFFQGLDRSISIWYVDNEI